MTRLLLALACLVLPPFSTAHPVNMVGATGLLTPAGEWRIEAHLLLAPLLAGTPDHHLSSHEMRLLEEMTPEEVARRREELRTRLARQVTVLFDGTPTTATVTIPVLEQVTTLVPLAQEYRTKTQSYPIVLSGRMPPGAVRFQLRTTIDAPLLDLTMEHEGGLYRRRDLISPGTTLNRYPVPISWTTRPPEGGPSDGSSH